MRTVLALMLVLASSLAVRVGFAETDEADAQRRTMARDLALQGADAYDQADYETALDRFSRAAALVTAPTLVVMQARALVGLGRWIEAMDKYREARRVPVVADAPEPFHQALRDAELESAQLERRAPRLHVRIDPGATGVSVAVDGKVLPPALLNVDHPIDPGVHQLEASAPGEPPFTEQVELQEGQRWEVAIPFRAAAPVAEELAPVAPPAPLAPEVSREEVAQRDGAPAWVAPVSFTLGGAGAATALFGAILAAERHTQLERVCKPGCPPEAAGDLEGFRLFRGMALAGGALALLGAGVGTYFLVWGSDSSENVAFVLSPTGAALGGAF